MNKQELLKLFANDSRAQRYRRGDKIVTEGSMPDEGVGFLLTGEVRVIKTQNARTVVLGTIQAGQFFGETAIVLARPRMASVEVTSDEAAVIFLPKKAFIQESNSNTALLEHLIDHAIRRVESVQAILARLAEHNEYLIDPTLTPIIEENRLRNLAIVQMLNHARTAWIGNGKAVFLQGSRNDGQTYLVVKGEITAIITQGKQHIPVFRFGEGDIFGYSHLDLSPVRRYSALCLDDTARIISFDETLLKRLVRVNPEVFFFVLRSIITHMVILDDTVRILSARQNSSPGNEETMKTILKDMGAIQTSEVGKAQGLETGIKDDVDVEADADITV